MLQTVTAEFDVHLPGREGFMAVAIELHYGKCVGCSVFGT